MEVKDIIKQKRTELGLTLEEVARAVGVSATTVLRWENGDIANMRRDKIVKLANVLNVSPAVIMGWEEPASDSYYLDPEAAELADELHKRPELKVLFKASKNVSKEDLQYVSDLLERLKREQFGDDD